MEKDYKKQLEKSLRTLGVFKKDEPIIITDYKQGEEFSDFMYEVRDLNNTIFTFYNFRLGHMGDYRFKENYLLTMKRENSNFYYKYDFKEIEYVKYKQGIRMIEVSYPISENRIIKLERELNYPIRLIMGEETKKYVLCFNSSNEQDSLLLENFEKLVSKALNIEDLNLENTLNLIEERKKIRCAYILKKDEVLASIDFINGKIFKYEYQFNNAYARTTKSINLYCSSPIGWDKYKIKRARNYQVKVIINDNIVRTVETEDTEKDTYITKLILEHNNEDIQSEIKMLIKII